MKLYSISKLVFWGVLILILLLPLGRHWKLLSVGERVDGTVKSYQPHTRINMVGETELFYASEVHFWSGDSMLPTLGPIDHEMAAEKIVPVYYMPGDPSENCIFTFVCLYYTSYSILPVILLIVWYAFYLTFNNYKREKKGESHTPASSPYTPFRRGRPNGKDDSDKKRSISENTKEGS